MKHLKRAIKAVSWNVDWIWQRWQFMIIGMIMIIDHQIIGKKSKDLNPCSLFSICAETLDIFVCFF